LFRVRIAVMAGCVVGNRKHIRFHRAERVLSGKKDCVTWFGIR